MTLLITIIALNLQLYLINVFARVYTNYTIIDNFMNYGNTKRVTKLY